jgi:O-antigen/teichoic acid export membrane protein
MWSNVSAEVTAGTAAKCFLLATVISMMAAVTWWLRGHSWANWSSGHFDIRLLHQIAWPMLGSILCVQATTWLPQIVLGMLRGSEEVAFYSVAFRTANLTAIALMGVNSVVFPRFAALYASGELDRLRRISQSSTAVMVLVCLPFLGLLLTYPRLALQLFGDAFVAGHVALRILALGQLVNVATGSVGGLLMMTGHQADVFRNGLISFVTLCVLLVLLTPALGSTGAAIAQAVALSVNMAGMSMSSMARLGFAPVAWRFPFRIQASPPK